MDKKRSKIYERWVNAKFKMHGGREFFEHLLKLEKESGIEGIAHKVLKRNKDKDKNNDKP
ncbi:hypothetical protein [Raineya orbicola]|uniref:Uncharacterized protein n=1 Tax=Raineya orbicola TaxID=2016530 RepID=A0A2N3I738_9BACT|nr:hypothetical protein [Raineya orbicola]PKQ66063.1 hypothetical protein Rain11_2492 [Raineya orbicola]